MPKTYTTSQGDLFDTIAKAQLGDEHYMHLLIEKNFKYRDISVFHSGIVLELPEITETESSQLNENLPPWKR